ncbi:hypothetical protein GGR56DRAFT_48967 [Xylariaceae sp. FL0804]|nr:hypothetical protein GGR56DRAFT_48967 [Xylariaceae sp. FL0804]
MPPGIFNSTYWDQRNHQTAALIRARRPYLFKNAVTGISLFAMTVGIYFYTIHAIGQDEFTDVKVPPAPVAPAPVASSSSKDAVKTRPPS